MPRHLDGVIKPVRRPLYYSSHFWFSTHQNISEKNYYDILGVKRDASIAEIKTAFYKLSKKYHPDAVNKSRDVNMQGTIYLEIKDAYEVLKDKKNDKIMIWDLRIRSHFIRHTGNTVKLRFYARTPQYDNDIWYEWYRKRRMNQMEARWIRKNTEDYWLGTVMVVFVASFVFSMIIRIRSEHRQRKEWIGNLARKNNTQETDDKNLKRYPGTVQKRIYHPDITGSAAESALTERFIAIKEAYDVLKDVESRNEYDAYQAQTSHDYGRQNYNRQSAGYTSYGSWRSNRFTGSNTYRTSWRYDDAHLKRVFEELQRRADEYEKAQKERDDRFWEKFYQAERERYKRRQQMPPRPSVKLAIDSWLSGPLLPYLPYLSAVLIIYMIGFFILSLYNIVMGKKIPDGITEDCQPPTNLNEAKIEEYIRSEYISSEIFDCTAICSIQKKEKEKKNYILISLTSLVYVAKAGELVKTRSRVGCCGEAGVLMKLFGYKEYNDLAEQTIFRSFTMSYIGCWSWWYRLRIIKNLALTGFSNIEIIDLDTIDVSNLNRQFLFRREHVGKPKAIIAAEAVRSFAPNVRIVCHHDSVLKEEYAARNHINRLCLAARVPLIESGSSGYLGHVRLIIRDYTECYECNPKTVQKTYPGCTIRNTPSEHIHCIVWAKHLLSSQLFGEPDDEDEVSPDFTDEENLEGQSTNNNDRKNGNSALNTGGKIDDGPLMHDNGGLLNRINTRKWAAENDYDPKSFSENMTNLWKQRRKPFPLDWDNLPNENASSSNNEPDAELWTVMQCNIEFEKAVSILCKRVKDGSVLSWDKDDDPAMRFVAACANLRAHIFSIPLKTLFDIKCKFLKRILADFVLETVAGL
ncbi:SUMO-activating enzyme subunit 2 [Dirofilaria immitis]|nr:SUMO-activating enzyme subunit 2 [Dirofilaria immitis]